MSLPNLCGVTLGWCVYVLMDCGAGTAKPECAGVCRGGGDEQTEREAVQLGIRCACGWLGASGLHPNSSTTGAAGLPCRLTIAYRRAFPLEFSHALSERGLLVHRVVQDCRPVLRRHSA